MAGRRNLPPFAERTPEQQIESGWRLTESQRQIYEDWDKKILFLKLKGRSHQEISEAIGCSEIHVRKRFPHVLAAESKRLAEVAQMEIVEQIATLKMLLSDLHQQWEKSCLEKVETTAGTEGEGLYQEDGGILQSVPAGKFKQSSRETKTQQTGDPRLVEQIRATMADIRKLLRLDKDDTLKEILAQINFTQVNINTGDGPLIPITAMTPQALAETAELLAALGMNPDGTVMTKKLSAEDLSEKHPELDTANPPSS